LTIPLDSPRLTHSSAFASPGRLSRRHSDSSAGNLFDRSPVEEVRPRWTPNRTSTLPKCPTFTRVSRDSCNALPRYQRSALRGGLTATAILRKNVPQVGGTTKIGMIKPTAMLAIFPGSEAMRSVAEEVERQTIKMIEEAK